MNYSRPKNLNLLTIQFPLPAIVSILHRISGFILFMIIPFMLWVLSCSLTDHGFNIIHQVLGNIYIQLLVWLLLIPFCFHLVAGIRHLFSDIHIGDTLKLGRILSLFTFILSFLLIISVGIWLW